MLHTIPRSSLAENGSLSFEVAGARYVVADLSGDVRAFLVTGRASHDLDRAVVYEGALLCPMHGWAIDPEQGRCGASAACRYRSVPVEVVGEEIRVHTP